FARWETVATADGRCHPDALAWVDGDDRVVWKRPLPVRMRGISLGPCNEQELSKYRRSPRTASGELFDMFIADIGGALVEGDVTGVLALRKIDGAVVLDVAAPITATSIDVLGFDDGTFEVAGLAGCKGSARHGRVFARCGDRVVYFNG